MCLHRDHHLDLRPKSIKHALPISDTRFSSNTTFNIHFTISFACLFLFKSIPSCISSNQFISFHFQHPKAVVPFHSSIFPNNHIHADTTVLLHIHTLACLLPYSSILLCQQSIYFLTLQLYFSISIFIWANNPLVCPSSHTFFITISICTCKYIPTCCFASSSFIIIYLLLSFCSRIIYSACFPHVPMLWIIMFRSVIQSFTLSFTHPFCSHTNYPHLTIHPLVPLLHSY